MKNNLLKCNVDEEGLLVEPQVHDATIENIKFLEHEFVLTLVSPKLKTINLLFSGVLEVFCDRLRKGNIVLDITVYSGNDNIYRLINMLYPKPRIRNEKWTPLFGQPLK